MILNYQTLIKIYIIYFRDNNIQTIISVMNNRILIIYYKLLIYYNFIKLLKPII